jgi:hypothetical protein
MPFIQPTKALASQRGVPNITTKLTVPFIPLLFQITLPPTPDHTIQVSDWIPVQPGSVVEGKLTVTILTGTLDVLLETTSNPLDPNEAPRPLSQQFDSVAALPYVSVVTAECDAFIRLTATPGLGAGQTATWAANLKVYHGGTRDPV